MSQSKIKEKIFNNIKRVAEMHRLRKEDKSTTWTHEIKKSLTKLGHKLGYAVYAAHKDLVNSDRREWLYDLCWAKQRGKDWKTLNSLSLIAEIEWWNDSSHIAEDFKKLTVGIAAYRLMVTWYRDKKNKRNPEVIAEECKRMCPPRSGRYIMVFIPDNCCPSINNDLYYWIA